MYVLNYSKYEKQMDDIIEYITLNVQTIMMLDKLAKKNDRVEINQIQSSVNVKKVMTFALVTNILIDPQLIQVSNIVGKGIDKENHEILFSDSHKILQNHLEKELNEIGYYDDLLTIQEIKFRIKKNIEQLKQNIVERTVNNKNDNEKTPETNSYYEMILGFVFGVFMIKKAIDKVNDLMTQYEDFKVKVKEIIGNVRDIGTKLLYTSVGGAILLKFIKKASKEQFKYRRDIAQMFLENLA